MRKFALVTGAGRGLGKGFVEFLSQNGYFVFAGVRKISPEHVNSENIQYVVLDVSDNSSIDSAFIEVQSKTNSLDLIINNAGINKDSVAEGHTELVCKVKEVKRDLLLEMFNINTISPLLIVQKFLPLLKNTPTYIINISSSRASFHDEFADSNPNYGYTASKIALNMFTYHLAKELPENVKTFAVDPGDVKTDMNQDGEQLPIEQVEKIMSITKNWRDEFSGKFMRWSGAEYPL